LGSGDIHQTPFLKNRRIPKILNRVGEYSYFNVKIIMESKVKVYGKAKGWTALGIIHAYLKIHPYATLEDLNKAFPREKFTSAKSIPNLLEDLKIMEKEANDSGNERAIADVALWKRIHHYITLADGTDVTFNKVIWGQTNFPIIEE